MSSPYSILFIESHPDDLVQSAVELLDTKVPMLVLTFDCSDERSTYGYTQHNPLITTIMLPTSEVHFKHAGSIDPEVLQRRAESVQQMCHYLETLHPILSTIPRVIIPRGLYHPQHIDCAKACELHFLENREVEGQWVYENIDQPYLATWISDDSRKSIMEQRYDFWSPAALMKGLGYMSVGDYINVPTPEYDRATWMRKFYKPKHLTRSEGKITCSLYHRVK